jgi:ubiquitin thioesterase CYLD
LDFYPSQFLKVIASLIIFYYFINVSDPEEFFKALLHEVLRAEPFLKLNSGLEAYHYQLFVEKDEDLLLPTVQQLLEQSFRASDIKLKEVLPE